MNTPGRSVSYDDIMSVEFFLHPRRASVPALNHLCEEVTGAQGFDLKEGLLPDGLTEAQSYKLSRLFFNDRNTCHLMAQVCPAGLRAVIDRVAEAFINDRSAHVPWGDFLHVPYSEDGEQTVDGAKKALVNHCYCSGGGASGILGGAVLGKQTQALPWIVDYGACLLCGYDTEKETPLIYALVHGPDESVQILLDAHRDQNAPFVPDGSGFSQDHVGHHRRKIEINAESEEPFNFLDFYPSMARATLILAYEGGDELQDFANSVDVMRSAIPDIQNHIKNYGSDSLCPAPLPEFLERLKGFCAQEMSPDVASRAIQTLNDCLHEPEAQSAPQPLTT